MGYAHSFPGSNIRSPGSSVSADRQTGQILLPQPLTQDLIITQDYYGTMVDTTIADLFRLKSRLLFKDSFQFAALYIRPKYRLFIIDNRLGFIRFLLMKHVYLFWTIHYNTCTHSSDRVRTGS